MLSSVGWNEPCPHFALSRANIPVEGGWPSRISLAKIMFGGCDPFKSRQSDLINSWVFIIQILLCVKRKVNPNTCKERLILRHKTLISFWDMLRILANEMLALLSTLQLHSNSAYHRGLEAGSKADTNARENLIDLLDKAESSCENMELTKTAAIVSTFRLQLKSSPPLSSYQAIHSQLGSIISCVQNELRSRTFVFIPESEAALFERDDLFEQVVNEKFPNAKNHIKSAGNCRAAELYTAAAYHLMCIANLGLIGLARYLRVRIKRTPLEYAEWQRLIDGVEAKLKQKTVRPTGNKQRQSEARQFYHGILSDVKFLDIRGI